MKKKIDTIVRKYLNVDDIQKQYLPISKKKIRTLIKNHLPVKLIGGRMFVEREELEKLLHNCEGDSFKLS